MSIGGFGLTSRSHGADPCGERIGELPSIGDGRKEPNSRPLGPEHIVRFSHADDFFKAMAQARVDNSVDCTFLPFMSPDLLILDDLGLHWLTAQQCAVHTL